MTPTALAYALWAKTNDYERRDAAARGEAVPAWKRHPLPLHLLDVGLVAEVWLRDAPRLLDRFCALWAGVPREDVRRLVVLVTALHDWGKAHRHFSAKSEHGWAAGYGGDRPQETDHRGFDHGKATAVFADTLIQSRPCRLLFRVAAGHHGQLYGGDDLAEVAEPTNEECAVAEALLAEVQHHFGALPQALPGKPSAAFRMLLAGFVSVADWFGSDERRFAFAPEVADRAGAERYLAGLRDRRVAEEALEAAGLLGRFETHAEPFEPFFGFDALKPLQTCADAVPFGEAAGAEIAVVEAAMGEGKTEIAQHLAARALAAGHARGLYFALPTQASANALLKRTTRFAERVGRGDLAFALAHSGRHYVSEYRALRQKKQSHPLEGRARPSGYGEDTREAPASVTAPSWLLASKRGLLAPIGLGTIDQALLGTIQVRHAFVRLFSLAGKVVVLDEVHAYDAYTGSLLLHALRWLRVLGAKVILLSATLPDGLRCALLEAYGVQAEPAEDPAGVPYPLMLHGRDGEQARAFTPAETALHTEGKTVAMRVREAEDVTEAGMAEVLRLAEGGGCVGWIRNTVREAQDAARLLAKALPEGTRLVLLHARFTRADRSEIEEALVEELGADAERRPERLVVVATQVIEQSVDLDFDALVSDLAPVDLLLQRAGRLHRHDRPRAVRQGHDSPRLTVLMPTPEARRALRYGASAYVYDAETLARSAALVQRHPSWAMPQACRTLVAALYDAPESAWTAETMDVEGEALAKARTRFEKNQAEMRRCAAAIQMPGPDTRRFSMHDARRDASDDGAHVALATRYGGRTATLCFFAPGGQPLGKPRQHLPDDPDSFAQRLRAEEAVALSSVSFPWFDDVPDDPPQHDAPRGWQRWWRERHRYDDRRFVELGPDGGFALADLHGRYTPGEGLVVLRSGKDLPEKPFARL